MKNPYEDLFIPTLEDTEGEEVGGAFSCQEQGCYSVVTTAKYLREIKTLTWICPEEHISKIEDFDIDW